jgi:predicted Zn-dependent peptidase
LAQVEELVRDLFEGLDRAPVSLPPQTALNRSRFSRREKRMEVAQGKLCMGFVTPVTIRDPDFPAMQLLNMVLGGDVTSKLFQKIREEQSLCYAVSSAYHGAKGILTVSAGIDSSREETVKAAVLEQLEACRRGEITARELEAAREALRSSLLEIHDSPGAIENYYATAALSGLSLDPGAYMEALEGVTVDKLRQLARDVKPGAVYFLKGVAQ